MSLIPPEVARKLLFIKKVVPLPANIFKSEFSLFWNSIASSKDKRYFKKYFNWKLLSQINPMTDV